MIWNHRTGILFFGIAMAASTPIFADDVIALRVQKGPGPSTATLSWTGSIPNFDLFRATSRATVTNPSNLLLVTGARQQTDATLPPSGSVLYYVVTSVGPCAPLGPAAICTAAERC